MPALQSVMYNVLCKDLSASVAFYRQLFGLETIYDSDWYIILTPPGQRSVQIGLIDQVSQFTPRHAWGMHEATYLTFVVDDVFEVMARAQALGAEVVAEPVAMNYGHTRGLIRDGNGMVLDISTPTAMLMEDAATGTADPQASISQPQPVEREEPQPA